MNTHLSHLLPVWEAGEIIGESTILHLTTSLIRFRQSTTTSSSTTKHTTHTNTNTHPPNPISEQEVPSLVAALLYRPSSTTSISTTTTVPRRTRTIGSSLRYHNDDTEDEYNEYDDDEYEYDKPPPSPHRVSSSSNINIPNHIQEGWKCWWTHPSLQFVDGRTSQGKQMLLAFVIPHSIQPGGIQIPHPSSSSNQNNNHNNHNNFGHAGLFDCWMHSLQGHSSDPHHTRPTMSSSSSSNVTTSSKTSTTTTTIPSKSNVPSSSSSSSSSYYYNQNNNPAHYNPNITVSNDNDTNNTNNIIWIPDVIIFWAICQQYRQYRLDFMQRHVEEESHDETNRGMMMDTSTQSVQSAIAGDYHRREQRIVRTMARLAFRIYSSYNNNNNKSSHSTTRTLTRDTIHRFMTDIYGEESYQIPTHVALLDAIFYHNPNHNNTNNTSISSRRHDTNHPPTTTSPNSTTTTSTNAWLHATVTEAQFCARCLDTVRPDNGSHILLDWISVLGMTMVPLSSSSLTPHSTTTTTNHITNKNSNNNNTVQQYLNIIYSTKPPLCSIYQLTESRLYEIKRRFHSLVQQPIPLSTTNMMSLNNNNDASSNATTTTTTTTSDTAHTTTAMMEPNVNNTTSPNHSNNSNSSSSNTNRHVISPAVFCYGVSSNKEDGGSGGYIPMSLAQLVFRTGYYYSINDHYNGSSRIDNMSASVPSMAFQSMDSSNIGWTLYHVLQFGCIALRVDSNTTTSSVTTLIRNDHKSIHVMDIPLLRFLFAMFLYADQYDTNDTATTNTDRGDDDDDNDNTTRTTTTIDETITALSRKKVMNMILYLIEHAEFRRRVDSPPSDMDDDDDDDSTHHRPISRTEDQNVSLSTVVSLGLVDPPEGAKPSDQILLTTVIDHILVDSGTTATKNCMTFDEFCIWNHYGTKNSTTTTTLTDALQSLDVSNSSSNMDASNRSSFGNSPGNSKKRRNTIGRGRLNPLMMDLRLIAGVKFGIPPTLASMEVSLIAEIERRHQRRYPTSDVSRRGPRGTVWNVIDATWFKSWATLVQSVEGTEEDAADGRGDPRSDRVRGLFRISNTGLLIENGSLSLRKEIRWKHDYELIAPLAWSALQAWYDGGPPIQRSVVRYLPISGSTASPHSTNRAPIPTENEIELHPYFATVYLCDVTSRGIARPFQQNYQMSCVSPILVLLVQLCKELDVSPDSARLWVIGSSNTTNAASDGHDVRSDDWILDTSLNIVEQRKRRGVPTDERVVLLLELKDKDTGLWPRGIDGKEWSFRDGSAPALIPTDLGDGIVGLYNMGNTCYLNSSIQCLSHTPILREYFTSKAYYKDINKTNPLGYEGRLAQVSAVLINELWKKSYNSTPHSRRSPGLNTPLLNAPALTPKTFKESLGKFNEIFAGNEQHDAQELLAFLLGGLSEDLNRIVEKPYMEAPDSDGRPDSELADIWWSNHLKREMSIIVALFTGQYKSLLTCRTCKYESARFEPFSFLQLPLPEDDYLSVSLIYYTAKEGCAPMKYCVRVRNDGSLHDVLVSLAKLLIQDETGGNLVKSSDPDGAESTALLHDLYLQRARGMAIVVMREGYIARMAANSWLLQDQQNKDSGELPLMHVYEFDPNPVTQPTTLNHWDENGSETIAETPHIPSPAFVAVAQRRSELLSRDVLHPLTHRVFGTPLLLRIHDIDSCTGRDLYDQVARRLKGVVQRSVLRFLSVSPDKSYEDRKRPANEGANDHRPGSGISYQTLTDMEDVSAGPVPRYGFRLRLTSRDGRRCLRCAWYESCIGCLIPDDDDPVIVGDGDSIVVDWHFAVDIATNGFGCRNTNGGDAVFANQSAQNSNSNRLRPPPVVYKNHSSCGVGLQNGKQAGAVTLEECLDAFSKEEKIPEAYCSKCKDFRVQTKRMSLWRLPPVMIIHLKRFQFTQTMRRKLRDLVVFPTEGLDLSRIIATDPLSTTADEATTKKLKENNQNGHSSEELKDTGRSEMLYDLYGVVHHQGALSGGHYVASLKSEIDGQWRLFNDAQIYDIHARDVVDPSAYILFYIRRDVANAQLSDYWDVNQGSNAISDQDMDQLLKGRSDRCVIS